MILSAFIPNGVDRLLALQIFAALFVPSERKTCLVIVAAPPLDIGHSREPWS